MSNSKRCGAHVELARNGSTRITRCGCGQVHLHILHSGVTVQVSDEHFREIAAAFATAVQDQEGAPSEAAPLSRTN